MPELDAELIDRSPALEELAHSTAEGGRSSSIRTVARSAGVSPSTASRSLRPGSVVAPETRARVLRAAQELGYRLPRSRERTRLVAVLARFPSQWFFAEAVSAAERVLAVQGQRLVLHNMSDPTSRAAFFNGVLPRGGFDGVIVISTSFTAAEQQALLALPVPGVVVGGYLSGWPRVGIDEAEAARAATQHLIGLGHRHIGLLSFDPDDPVGVETTQARRGGYLSALADSGLDADPRWILAAEGSRMEGGHTAAEYLLSQAELPTAVFAMSDELAIGALQAFRRAHLAVPEQLSLVGFDDHEMARYADLTTIYQPVTQQAELAAARLTNPVEGDTQLPFRLRVRATTGPAAPR